MNSGARLLRVVRNDLADVVRVCEAKKKQTNYLRSLISDLAKGICSVWLCYPMVVQMMIKLLSPTELLVWISLKLMLTVLMLAKGA